jgi:hypothetical protein
METLYSACETAKYEVKMKHLNNERGIALVISLFLTVLILVSISALLYLVMQGTSMSGYQKRYQTALEAAKGGVDLATKEIITKTIGQLTLTDLSNAETRLQNSYSSINLAFVTSTSTTCLQSKLGLSTAQWTGCSTDNKSLDLKKSDGTNISDVTFRLAGPTSAQDYTVYAKIVDTSGGTVGGASGSTAPNTYKGGLDLGGQGVTGTQMTLAPMTHPFLFRVEIQAERTTNPDERSQLSVIYAY